MKRSTLAARLIDAGTNTERKKLLAENGKLADVRLARLLKDECYRTWTDEPVRARRIAVALKSLAAFSPSKETEAMMSWVEGIASITRGKLELAIEKLDAASKVLSQLKLHHDSARPQVPKLIALAMLGRYDEAQAAGRKALRIFEKYGDQLAAGKIEMNLSNVVSRRDQYRLAEKYCLSAYKRFAKLGETTWQTMAENGLANTYAELNEFHRAEKFYTRALERARAGRMRLTVAEIEASMGNLELFRGRYADALRRLERSRQMYEKLEMPHQTAIADLEIADIYAELNLIGEATEMYRQLVVTLRSLKMRAEEARARTNFGQALLTAGDPRQARVELSRASALYELEKNSIAAAAVDLRRASLEVALGNHEAALVIADASYARLQDRGNVRLVLSAMWLRGDVLSRLGRHAEAEQLLAQSLKEARRFEQPAIAQLAMNSLGVSKWKQGDLNRAEKLFADAIASAEAARSPLPGEEFRMAFLSKTLEPYTNLARLHLQRGDVRSAFVSFERARSRSLIENVTSPARRDSSASSKVREELNWYYSRLDRADEGELQKLQTEIRRRERQLATNSLRTQSTSKGSASSAAHLNVEELQKRLGPRGALVEFVADAGVYSAFVVTSDSLEHVASLTSDDEIMSLLEGLHFQFGSLRFGGEAVRQFAGQLKSRADFYLEKLYAKLLRPIEWLIGERDLVVVPAGALNYVPFHALFDGAKYAIESREVISAPSAAVWLRLNRSGRRSLARALLMSFADEKIPLVDREVKRLAESLPGSKRLSGRSATFAAFQEQAPKFDIVHLACHGQFRPDNPMFSSLHLADGWVTVRDVCERKLKASLVTLSACETGLSKVFPGEEILGLARGFLTAGARSLVLTLWTVNDEAAERLMADFYETLQRGGAIAASLRDAQLRKIDGGEHPYYWAPFFVVG